MKRSEEEVGWRTFISDKENGNEFEMVWSCKT